MTEQNATSSDTTLPVSAPFSGDLAILAGRYATALYALADQDKVVDAVTLEMRALRRLWDECAEWRMVAVDPRLTQTESDRLVSVVVKSCGLGSLSTNFVLLVGKNRRLAALPAMIDRFLADVASRRGEHHADVRTAKALTSAQRDALVASLAAATGGKVHLSVVEDASILGGLTVKIGSQFIDASVKTKLDRLERSLIAGTAA